MKYDAFYITEGHDYVSYEASHGPRLDFLVKDLALNYTQGRVADIGCGLGFIHRRLSPDVQKRYVGFDATELTEPAFEYHQQDLDQPTTYTGEKFQTALCFETLEHLTNPYQCLVNIKNLLVENGVLHLSIPHEATTHNTIYPALLYPVKNFGEFLAQMAFGIERHVIHDKSFVQHVYTLRNLPWSESRMKWFKDEPKFRNIPPHVAVNL